MCAARRATTRPTSRRCACPSRRSNRSTASPPRTSRTRPDTPTIDTLVDLLNAREDLRRTDREWSAADTLKNLLVMLRHPDGTREPLAIAVPGDRDIDLTPARGPGRCRRRPTPFTDADFAARPELVKGYIGPGILGKGSASGIRFLVDPRIVTGTALGHRRRRARPARDRPRRRARLHARRRARRRRRASTETRARRAGPRWRSRGASRSGTSSNSDACTPRPSGSRCSDPTASR